MEILHHISHLDILGIYALEVEEPHLDDKILPLLNLPVEGDGIEIGVEEHVGALYLGDERYFLRIFPGFHREIAYVDARLLLDPFFLVCRAERDLHHFRLAGHQGEFWGIDRDEALQPVVAQRYLLLPVHDVHDAELLFGELPFLEQHLDEEVIGGEWRRGGLLEALRDVCLVLDVEDAAPRNQYGEQDDDEKQQWGAEVVLARMHLLHPAHLPGPVPAHGAPPRKGRTEGGEIKLLFTCPPLFHLAQLPSLPGMML